MARSRDAVMPEPVATPAAVPSPDGNPAVLARLPMITQPPILPVVEAWCSMVTEYQREMADFVTTRLEKDKECLREVQAAKDLAETLAIQARWLQQTMHDYAAEMSRMVTIPSKHGGIRVTTAMLQ